VRIALTRRWGNVHLGGENDDPKISPGVSIELRAEEAAEGEWPDEVVQALDEIVQSDPVSVLPISGITLRQVS